MGEIPDKSAVPDWMKGRNQWRLWSSDSNPPKKPLDAKATGRGWNDPGCWLSFEEAYELAKTDSRFDGIGFVVSKADPYFGIDVDSALREANEEKPKEWVPSLELFVDTAYAQFSTSGTGFHLFGEGEIPEWWSDEHFDDREHEGVEAYEEKFFIVTGNELSISAGEPQEVDPTPWLLKAYQELYGRLPRELSSSDSDSDDYDGDSDLSKGTVEDALSNLDPSMTHDEWVRVGFAVHAWDSGSTGKSVFEDWSRGSSKYDNAAQNTIDWIWSNADDSGGVSVGTLVHKAKKEGWSYPKKTTDGGATTATQSSNPDLDAGPEYELNARELIALLGYDPEETDIRDIATHELANGIEQMLQSRDDIHINLLDTVDNKDQPIYTMDEETKVWEEKGERRLAQLARMILGFQNRKKIQSELANALRSNPSGYWIVDRDKLGIEVGQVPLKNQVLDLETRDSRSAHPDDYLLGRLPTEYDPNETIEGTRFEEFLLQSVKPEDRKKLQEYAGYTLLKNAQPYKKALFLVGPTDSGKGTFLKTLESILGEDNVASETLYNLVNTRWGTHSIYGKMANISNEVSPQGVSNVGQFKMLTGGEDKVPAEDKGVSKYRFTVTQKFLFATNEFPEVENADKAFFNRLLFVEFPNSFSDNKDETLKDDLREERSAILNWMLDGLDRLRENGEFTNERSLDEKKDITKAFGSIIEQFAHNAVEITGDSEHVVHKKELYAAFTRYCDFMSADTPTQTKFTRELKGESGISDGTSTRVSDDGNQKGVFKGVKVKDGFFQKIQADVPSHSYSDDRGGQQQLG